MEHLLNEYFKFNSKNSNINQEIKLVQQLDPNKICTISGAHK